MDERAFYIVVFLIVIGLWSLFRRIIDQRGEPEREIIPVPKLSPKKPRKKYGDDPLLRQVYDIAKQHSRELAVQRERTTYPDPYGGEDDRKWKYFEIMYFIENHVLPNLNGRSRNFEIKTRITEIKLVIDEVAKSASHLTRTKKSVNAEFSSGMTGTDYEEYCLKILEANDFRVQLTKASGDQGIDIIAEKAGIKWGIQCKKYSRPVGNKAVQEVSSGVKFYDLHRGIVVSNAPFTPSAKQLAKKQSVRLIHHSNLGSLN